MSATLTSAMTSYYIQYHLNKSTNAYNNSMDQLASGNKLVNVADNPVGASEIVKTDVQITSTARAASNASIGQDLLSVAEDGQNLAMTNLLRIRELAMQAASETYSSENKDAILAEIRARLSDIDRSATATNFNGIKLADGSAKTNNLTLQIGSNSTATLNIGPGLPDIHAAALGVDIPAATTGATWTTTTIGAYLTQIDNAMSTLSTATSQLGGYQNRLDYSASTLSSMTLSLNATRSQLADPDVAEVSGEIVQNQILQQAAVSILTQANSLPQMVVSLLSPS